MPARFWIATLACAAIVSSSGCGSCRWHNCRGIIPWACVEPRCGDAACMVCSPIPPLYDGWSNQQAMFGSHGSGCSCGGMDGGTCDAGDGSCGMPQMSGPCPNCGHSMTSSVMQDGESARAHNAMIFSTPPVEFSTPPTEPTPSAPSKDNAPSSTVPSASAVPLDSFAPLMKELTAPEPPMASPTSGVQPFDFYAPNKPAIGGPAPVPLSGPIRLTNPPVWETSIEIAPVEQASLKAPSLP